MDIKKEPEDNFYDIKQESIEDDEYDSYSRKQYYDVVIKQERTELNENDDEDQNSQPRSHLSEDLIDPPTNSVCEINIKTEYGIDNTNSEMTIQVKDEFLPPEDDVPDAEMSICHTEVKMEVSGVEDIPTKSQTPDGYAEVFFDKQSSTPSSKSDKSSPGAGKKNSKNKVKSTQKGGRMCSICNCKFSNLKRHQLTHILPFTCDICNCKCKDLELHKSIHEEGGNPFVCQSCDYECESAAQLNSHHLMHTDKCLACDVCDYRCTAYSGMKAHKLIHTGERPFPCTVCKYRCTSSSGLKTHMLVHMGEKPHACDMCNFRCTTASNLKQHRIVHTGDKPFTCQTCDRKFTTSTRLKQHRYMHTGEKPYACKLCDYACRGLNTLKQHEVKKHTTNGDENCIKNEDGVIVKIKKFECEICQSRFVTPAGFQRHKRIHSGEKLVTCQFCDYKSVSKATMRTHRMTHSGERPFSCQDCDYKCTTASSLKKHKFIHTGERPYACNKCDYKCRSTSSLQKHRSVHTEERPYQCPVCDYRSKDPSNLKLHTRRHSEIKNPKRTVDESSDVDK